MRRPSFKQRLTEAVENRLWELDVAKLKQRYSFEQYRLREALYVLNNRGSGPLPRYLYELGRDLDVWP